MLPDLVKNLRSLVASQYAEEDRASVDVETLAAACLACCLLLDMNEGVAGTKQSTSTDGNLTVLHRPDAGKKLGSHRQPRADCSHSKQKKKKIVTV